MFCKHTLSLSVSYPPLQGPRSSECTLGRGESQRQVFVFVLIILTAQDPTYVVFDELDILPYYVKAESDGVLLCRLALVKIVRFLTHMDGSEVEQHRLLATLVTCLCLLSRVSRVEELSLNIMGLTQMSASFLGRKLSSVVFKHLETFTSRTLPHYIVSKFIACQTSVVRLHLSMTPCKGACSIDVRDLRGLCSVSVSCAARCTSAVVPGKPVFHVQATDRHRSVDNQGVLLRMCRALRQSLAPTGITSLELTFASTQRDILHLVISVAPRVANLSLIEIKDVVRLLAI